MLARLQPEERAAVTVVAALAGHYAEVDRRPNQHQDGNEVEKSGRCRPHHDDRCQNDRGPPSRPTTVVQALGQDAGAAVEQRWIDDPAGQLQQALGGRCIEPEDEQQQAHPDDERQLPYPSGRGQEELAPVDFRIHDKADSKTAKGTSATLASPTRQVKEIAASPLVCSFAARPAA